MRFIYTIAVFVLASVFGLQNIVAQTTGKTNDRIRKHEIGFNSTFLIQEFLGILDVNNLQKNTVVQYKWVRKPTAKWVPRVGLGGNLLLHSKPADEDLSYGGHLRLGIERRIWASPKIALFFGPDLMGESDYRSRIITTDQLEVRNTDFMYRVGVAPFWGLMYRPVSFLSLSIESAFVAFYRYDTAVTDFIRGGDDVVFKSYAINAKYDYPINIYVSFRF